MTRDEPSHYCNTIISEGIQLPPPPFKVGGWNLEPSLSRPPPSPMTIPLLKLIVPWQVSITGERSVNESDAVELNCTSSRLATLSWFKKENSNRLTKIVPTSNSRVSIVSREVEGSSVYSILTIRSVTVSDNNTFVCEAQDDDGFSSRVDHAVRINGIVLINIILFTI